MFLLCICNPTPFLASESVLWLVSKSNRISDPEEWETKPLQSFIPVHPWLTGPILCLHLNYPGYGLQLKRPHWTLGVSVWRECAACWSLRPQCPLWSGNRWGCYRKTGPAVCHWWSVWACWCLAEWFSECPWKRGRVGQSLKVACSCWRHRMYCTTEKSHFVHLVQHLLIHTSGIPMQSAVPIDRKKLHFSNLAFLLSLLVMRGK